MTPPRTQRQSHETPFNVLVEVEFRLHLNLRKNLLAVVGHFCRAKLGQFCHAPNHDERHEASEVARKVRHQGVETTLSMRRKSFPPSNCYRSRNCDRISLRR